MKIYSLETGSILWVSCSRLWHLCYLTWQVVLCLSPTTPYPPTTDSSTASLLATCAFQEMGTESKDEVRYSVGQPHSNCHGAEAGGPCSAGDGPTANATRQKLRDLIVQMCLCLQLLPFLGWTRANVPFHLKNTSKTSGYKHIETVKWNFRSSQGMDLTEWTP